MESNVCPALKRSGGGFTCSYTGRSINPFAWYCIGKYVECPIYISRQRRQESEAATEVVSAAQELAQAGEVAERIEREQVLAVTRELEDALRSIVEDLVSRYEQHSRNLDDAWSKYEALVLEVRRKWEGDRSSLEKSITLLEDMLKRYDQILHEAEIQRTLRLISDRDYEELVEAINRRRESLRTYLDVIRARIDAVVSNLAEHTRRVITTSRSEAVERIRAQLSRLEELAKMGQVRPEVLELIKRELGI